MFRPLTVVAIAAFSLVGWHVYRAEEAATQLDREMRDLSRRIEQARERTQVLRAEWAMLNEPERLRQVAQRHLTLETMTPDQFVRIAELERRLPQAVAFAGPVSLFGSAPEVAVAAASPAALPATATAGAAPQPPAAARSGAGTAVLAAAAVGAVSSAVAAPRTAAETHHRPAAPRLAETPRAEPAIRPTPVSAPASSLAMAASRAEAPHRAPAPRPAAAAPVARQAAPASLGMTAQAKPPVTQVPLLRAAHVPAPRPLAAPIGGSALGMAGGGGLAPPVPLAAPVPVAPGAWRQ